MLNFFYLWVINQTIFMLFLRRIKINSHYFYKDNILYSQDIRFTYTLWSVSAYYPFQASRVYQSGDAKIWWLKWKVKWCTGLILNLDPCILKFVLYFNAVRITPSVDHLLHCAAQLWEARSSIKRLHCTKENILSWIWEFFCWFDFVFNFEEAKYEIDWTTLVHTDDTKM